MWWVFRLTLPCDPRRQWHPTPPLLPGESHGRRSLVGCSPWGREESDTTERLHFHFSLSCIGEGKGNPLQCSCLENPRDGEPGGRPSMGSHRVGHDWSDLAAVAAAAKEELIPVWVFTWRKQKHWFRKKCAHQCLSQPYLEYLRHGSNRSVHWYTKKENCTCMCV